MNERHELNLLLDKLAKKYPTRTLMAEALGVKYITVAHWFDGRSMPSFALTLKILQEVGIYGSQSPTP